jgi:hypothetical protein
MAERRRSRSLADGLRPLRPLVAVWLVAVGALAVVIAQQRVPQRALLLDPVSTARLPWYTGLLSNVGVLTWCVAATTAAMTAVATHVAGRSAATRLFAGGAAVSAVLLADDLLLIHSGLPGVVPLPKVVFELGLGGLVVLWIATNRAEVLRTRYHLLVAAAVALGVSVAVDTLRSDSVAALVAEDGAKLLGILAWATYFVATGRDVLRSTVRRTPGGPADGSEGGAEREPARAPR